MKYFLSLFQMFNLTMYIDGGEGGGSSNSDGADGADGGDGGDGGGADNGNANNNNDGANANGGGDDGANGGADGADGASNNNDGGVLLAGKYKDQEALEQGYKNLEQMFGSFKGTPKDGYAAIEGDSTPEQNRMMAVLQEFGKEAGLSQDGYESLYANISEMQERTAAESLEEVAKSIPNIDTRAKAMVDTAGKFLRPDQVDALNGLMVTKDGFEAVEALMSQMRGGVLPGSQAPAATDVRLIRDELNALAPGDTQNRTRLLNEINKAGDGVGRLV